MELVLSLSQNSFQHLKAGQTYLLKHAFRGIGSMALNLN
ncbi:hypothetical protein SynSYN20_02152 [Synechococcus sp. SYN20]|nr:hypothetical protein SynSYN20_02152 [Synechococcus sp. SYN20]